MHDVAAYLTSRLIPIIAHHQPRYDDPDWIAGIEPRITTSDPAVAELATQCETLIQTRLVELAHSNPPWAADLGPRPNTEPTHAAKWDEAKLAAVIYRDTWEIDAEDAIGPMPVRHERQLRDWRTARDLLNQIDWTPQPSGTIAQDMAVLDQIGYTDADEPTPDPGTKPGPPWDPGAGGPAGPVGP
jgi:hypothetical protein